MFKCVADTVSATTTTNRIYDLFPSPLCVFWWDVIWLKCIEVAVKVKEHLSVNQPNQSF